jgi:hypothetical protein
MSLVTIQGRFQGGKVVLDEAPIGVEEARVLVTFLPTGPEPKPTQYMKLGQFRGPAERMSTEADFEIAEWRPTPEELDGE